MADDEILKDNENSGYTYRPEPEIGGLDFVPNSADGPRRRTTKFINGLFLIFSVSSALKSHQLLQSKRVKSIIGVANVHSMPSGWGPAHNAANYQRLKLDLAKQEVISRLRARTIARWRGPFPNQKRQFAAFKRRGFSATPRKKAPPWVELYFRNQDKPGLLSRAYRSTRSFTSRLWDRGNLIAGKILNWKGLDYTLSFVDGMVPSPPYLHLLSRSTSNDFWVAYRDMIAKSLLWVAGHWITR